MKLKKIFEPRSVAVVGVSASNPSHPANVIFNKIRLKYKTRVYCVNPSGGEFFGDPVYRSVSRIPGRVDLAVIVIRSEHVPSVMEECVASDTGGAVVISGGFAETGRDDLQRRIVEISAKNGFPFIGPNCLGVYSPPHVDTFFLPNERFIEPRHGTVSLVSQSGGILIDQIIKLTQEGVGISRAVSIGNKAVIDEVEALRFLKKDRKTSVIGVYVEGFSPGRGRDFIEEVNSSDKPVVVLKAGKTPGGNRAVSSHTASMAGDYFVFSEIVKASGAFEAKNESEFVSYCEALSCFAGRRISNVCVITASGGHGAMASDGCHEAGLTLVEVPADDRRELKSRLSKNIMEIASLSNPVDLTGSAVDADFIRSMDFFMGRDYVDAAILLLLPYLPGISSDVGPRIAAVARQHKKPVITYMPHVEKYGIFKEGFESNGIPVAHSVEGAVHMARVLSRSHP